MQTVIDWVIAHWAVLIAPIIYEIWALIPETTVKSSSILTFIGGLLGMLKPKPAQLK